MFDPFENRKSRDIRNRLAELFLDLLQKRDWPEFERQVSALGEKASDPDHIRFIRKRVLAYRKVVDLCRDTDPFKTGRMLWDNHLFFECHEWLEPLWINAAGTRKKAVQGIIRAAGAQVLHEAGRTEAAQSSALKAAALIRDHRNAVPEAFDADELISILVRTLPDPAWD